MSFRIVVLAKQVPDTHNVGKNAMNPDGTINRAALPAIFNPEDLNALEMALSVKDAIEGATVTVITMGPPRAAEIVREAMYRGADNGYVLSDRRFAGSDTLATSYAIAKAVEKVGKVDMVFCGRQAIDGDTAQVGPQIAEKLGIPQITYAESLIDVNSNKVTIRRRLENGVEIVESSLPALVTVCDAAPECRFRHAHRLLKYRRACSASEAATSGINMEELWKAYPYLKIEEWNADDINPELVRLGMSGSPTKVKTVQNVVLSHKENQQVAPTQEALNAMMKELSDTHILD